MDGRPSFRGTAIVCLLMPLLAHSWFSGTARAQEAELAADLNPLRTHAGVGPYFRTHGLVAGESLFYLAATQDNHLELWRVNIAETLVPASADPDALPPRADVRLHVLVHNGKLGDFAPNLDRFDGVIDYGSAGPFPDPWQDFPKPPDLSYVNDRWGVVCDGRLFFTSHDPDVAVDTTELFVSHGTPEGTRLAKDIRPGEPGSGIFDLTAAGDRVFFFADDGVHGKELWVSDGSEAGTRLVRDVNPGAGHARAACGLYPFSHDTQIAVLGDEVYFVADDGTNGFAVWRTNGTEPGTTLIAAPYAGIEPRRRPTALTATSDAVYWVTADECGRLRPNDGAPRELWRLDATGEARICAAPAAFGAHLLHAGIHTGDPTPVGARLFFLADDGENGIHMWRAEAGGAGSVASLPREGGAGPANWGILGPAGSALYLAQLEQDDSATDEGPWLPRRVRSIWIFEADSATLRNILRFDRPDSPRMPVPRHAPTLLFTGKDTCFLAYRDDDEPVLYIHEPGADAARRGPELAHGRGKGARHDTLPFAASPGRVFLLADEGGTGLEVRAVSLATDWTGRAVDVFPARGLGSQITFLDVADASLFLRTEGPMGERAVWRHAVGALDETRLLFREPAPAHTHDHGAVYDFTPFRGRVYFTRDGALCSIDDSNGVTEVARLLPRGSKGHTGPLRKSNGRLVVFAASRESGIRLWSSDGTARGTAPREASIPGAYVDDAAVAGGNLYFEVIERDGSNGSGSLWVADEDGRTVRRVAGPYAAGALTAMQPAGDRLVFAERRDQAWTVRLTDGTENGTVELGVARDSFGGRSEVPLAVDADGRIVFMDTQDGGVLHVHRPKAGSSEPVRTRSIPRGRMLAGGLAVHEGRFYWMTAGAGFADMELWCSEGTRDTTRRIHNLGGRLLHELPLYVSTREGLYFVLAAADVRDDVHRELWLYRPGEDAARLVCRSSPLLGTLWEPGGTEIDVQLAVVNGTVLFTNYDHADGAELWRVSDQTP